MFVFFSILHKVPPLGGGILAHVAGAEVADIFQRKIPAVVIHRTGAQVVAVLHHVGEDFALFHVVLHRLVLPFLWGFSPSVIIV